MRRRLLLRESAGSLWAAAREAGPEEAEGAAD